MKFGITTGDGALAAGQGIGNAIKALAMSQYYRDKGEQDGFTSAARADQSMASARKANADAELAQNQLKFAQNPMESAMLQLNLPTALAPAFKDRLATGQWGGQYAPPELDGVGPFKPAPADDDTVSKLGQTLSLLQRMYGTGSNVDQGASAGLKELEGRNIERVIADPNMAAAVGKAYAATQGKPLFENVGNTGVSLDSFTGDQNTTNAVLAKLFGNVQTAQANRDNAAAGKSSADAAATRLESDILKSTGAKPGSGREASEGALSSTILNTLKVPALDEKGRPVRNPITGEQEMTVDLDAQRSFYEWADSNKRKPTATAFTQWEAQGRPGANKNPKPGANNSTMPEATKTIGGKTYVKVNGQWFEK